MGLLTTIGFVWNTQFRQKKRYDREMSKEREYVNSETHQYENSGWYRCKTFENIRMLMRARDFLRTIAVQKRQNLWNKCINASYHHIYEVVR